MIALTLALLFAVVALATFATLADCWLRGRLAWRMLARERALVAAGFLRMVEVEERRLLGPVRRASTATRPAAPLLVQHRSARSPARLPQPWSRPLPAPVRGGA